MCVAIDSGWVGAARGWILQRPMHREDGTEAALHPGWMHHHLPLCTILVSLNFDY
jgi:hypothetical protein